ncbi:hypothetical protein EST38_g548 [Candolleomyces aberdarensis]|uniref:Uncharacterized protein n=1 Tax=Candolleomyces aberdarensis TaxID=2316362 RepID=A0A4Q2DX33_9AGAR|nr:hypothetical protein EST38_g548 [Candolleomyces aberdarensis]
MLDPRMLRPADALSERPFSRGPLLRQVRWEAIWFGCNSNTTESGLRAAQVKRDKQFNRVVPIAHIHASNRGLQQS